MCLCTDVLRRLADFTGCVDDGIAAVGINACGWAPDEPASINPDRRPDDEGMGVRQPLSVQRYRARENPGEPLGILISECSSNVLKGVVTRGGPYTEAKNQLGLCMIKYLSTLDLKHQIRISRIYI